MIRTCELTFISLFAGIGGFDKSFEDVGMQCVLQVEKDKHCQRVLRQHFNTRLLSDVRMIRGGVLDEAPDLVCGGFPCQDISRAGRREGLAGKRSGLWFEFQRILHEYRPPWVVIENVPGLLSSNRGRDLGTILGSLGDMGYGWAYRVLDTQWFGTPQQRRRVFIVGHLGDGAASEVLFESERGARGSVSINEGAVGIAGCHPSRVDSNALPVSFHHQNRHGDHTPLFMDHVPTLMTSKVPVVWHDGIVRRLTPVECERLQGFPDGWTASVSNTHRYKMLGNAVSVPVTRWLGERINASI